MTPSTPIFANTGAAPTQGSSEALAANLRGQELNRLQRLRFLVWFMANALKGIGGTDYTSNLVNGSTSLRTVANTALIGFDRDMMDALEAFIYNRAAIAAGSSPGTSNLTWAASNAKNMRDLNEDDLNRMRVTLLDKIVAVKF